MEYRDAQKVVRHLAAAEGFLELGLPRAALAEVDAVPQPGPFTAISDLLRGEALQAQDRFDEAIAPLQSAVAVFPAPFSQRALVALSRCYRGTGRVELANEADAKIEELSGDQPRPLPLVPIFIATTVTRPVFKPTQDSADGAHDDESDDAEDEDFDASDFVDDDSDGDDLE